MPECRTLRSQGVRMGWGTSCPNEGSTSMSRGQSSSATPDSSRAIFRGRSPNSCLAWILERRCTCNICGRTSHWCLPE